jgi:hypothetical protein
VPGKYDLVQLDYSSSSSATATFVTESGTNQLFNLSVILQVPGKYDLVQLDYSSSSSATATDVTDSATNQPSIKEEPESGSSQSTPESKVMPY